MGQRLRFFIAQILWAALAIGLLINANELSNALMVFGPLILVGIINGFLLNWGSPDQTQSPQNDSVTVRALVSGFMWLVFVGATLLGAAELGGLIIPIAIIMMIPLLALSSFMWKSASDSSRKMTYTLDAANKEKRKRSRVDAMLRDLSDEDLVRLKQRLAYGDIEDDDLRYMLGDDGEIVNMDEDYRR